MPGPSSARLEKQLVKRRQAEFERFNFWNSNCTYFRSWEFNNNQFSNWTSPQFYTTRSEDITKKQQEKEKEERLNKRRERLKCLLSEECEMYQAEVKQINKPKTSVCELTVDDLKTINLGLLVRQEQERRQEREIRLYHQWRQNQPVVRQFESNQHKDFVKKHWMTQCAEMRQKKEAQLKEKQEYLEKLKDLERKEKEADEKLREEKKSRVGGLKIFLEKQIQELKDKNDEVKKLRLDESEMLAKQRRLQQLVDERKLIEQRNSRQDLSLFHKRQYQLVLKKRAEVVQRELEADAAMLARLAEEEEMRKEEDKARKSAVRRELELAREAFRTHSELEKMRSKQLNFLFDEEAKKLYEKQDEDWKKEKEARNQLLKDVLNTIDCQIKDKLVDNFKTQKQILEDKEDILKKMERARESLKLEEETQREKSTMLKTQLNRQMLERQLAEEEQIRREADERERELRAKEEEEQRLLDELRRMKIVGYQPKIVGRRKTQPS